MGGFYVLWRRTALFAIGGASSDAQEVISLLTFPVQLFGVCMCVYVCVCVMYNKPYGIFISNTKTYTHTHITRTHTRAHTHR